MSPFGEKQRAEALGLGLAALGLLVALAIVSGAVASDGGNLIGPAGGLIHRGLNAAFGVVGVLVTVPAFVWALRSFGLVHDERALRWSILSVGLLITAPTLLWLLSAAGGLSWEGRAGVVGSSVGALALSVFGPVGSLLLTTTLLLALLVLTLAWSPSSSLGTAARVIGSATRRAGNALRAGVGRARERLRDTRDEREMSPWEAAAYRPTEEEPELDEGESPVSEEVEVEEQLVLDESLRGGPQLDDPGDLAQVELPPLDLLDARSGSGQGLEREELQSLGETLIEKLQTFRVNGRIGGWTTGPVVTQFEVVPEAGVKVGQIAALADDLALALRAPSIRIVAPIPGKGAVGVEVPNPEPQIVGLRDVLESRAYRRSRAQLPLALGRDLSGAPYSADLARMPHLLIAGATGSGKSVCINTVITSLIYRYTPRELRLLMIDPKMVELMVYNDLPHLRHPVVTDNDEAPAILKWTVYEMNRRYHLLSANSCRNLPELNRRVRAGDAVPIKGSPHSEYTEGELPYIVLIVDELADLMMTVQGQVETPLAMLAQKARAVGIHLVIATQRPSVNIITGLIKANFPSRIAFRVASKIDSRTILDQNGAESLLGNGDMLFLPPGKADPVRVQGAFIDSRETERLVGWFREQLARRTEASATAPPEEADILELVREIEAEEAQVDVAADVLEEWDELFRQAAEICITNDAGSTSLLQRRLKIGYGRAARIVDQLHDVGILGPSEGSRPREVLVNLEQLQAMLGGEATAGTEQLGGGHHGGDVG
jgi:S-DNA-T family DNA segregation ATPase FtsK/SpoIIIE